MARRRSDAPRGAVLPLPVLPLDPLSLYREHHERTGERLHFFPLSHNTKVPLKDTRGVLDAAPGFDDPATRAATTQKGEHNLALATGHAKLIVFDLDVREDKNGLATLAELEKTHGVLPRTRSVRTPSGGRHLYFTTPEAADIRSGNAKLGPGFDIKAAGGYVVCPPSKINGKHYEFENDDPIAELPEAWEALLVLGTAIAQGRGQVPVGADDDWTLEDAKDMLAHIDADSSYDDWLRAGLALYNKFGDEAYDIFEQWSSCGSKFVKGEPRKKWESFRRSKTNNPVTMGTIVHLAMQEGWTPRVDLTTIYRMLESERPWKQIVTKLLKVNPPKARMKELIGAIAEKYTIEPRTITAFITENTRTADPNKIEWGAVNKSGRPLATQNNAVAAIQQGLRDIYKLSYDNFTKIVTVNGKPLEDEHITQVQIDCEKMLGATFGKDMTHDAIKFVARENETDMLADYLDSLDMGDNGAYHEFLAQLGIDNGTMADSMLRKTLVAAVARGYQPGYKHDTALILVGRQGTFKSSIFRELCPFESWFTDSMRAMTGRDDQMQLRGKWFAELAELSAMNRQTAEEVKHFLSMREDEYRPPYGREVVRYPRRCIFAGTTNDTEFLVDTTGNRRFWVLNLEPGEHVPKWLRDNRNRLWAHIKHMYRQGERTWFNAQEQTEATAMAQEHEIEHPWTAIIEDAVGKHGLFKIQYVLEIVLGIEPSRIKSTDAIMVSKILRKLGFKKKVVRIRDRTHKLWLNPDDDINEAQRKQGVFIGE